MEEIYETTYVFNPSLMRYEKVKETVVDCDWDDCYCNDSSCFE